VEGALRARPGRSQERPRRPRRPAPAPGDRRHRVGPLEAAALHQDRLSRRQARRLRRAPRAARVGGGAGGDLRSHGAQPGADVPGPPGGTEQRRREPLHSAAAFGGPRRARPFDAAPGVLGHAAGGSRALGHARWRRNRSAPGPGRGARRASQTARRPVAAARESRSLPSRGRRGSGDRRRLDPLLRAPGKAAPSHLGPVRQRPLAAPRHRSGWGARVAAVRGAAAPDRGRSAPRRALRRLVPAVGGHAAAAAAEANLLPAPLDEGVARFRRSARLAAAGHGRLTIRARFPPPPTRSARSRG
jgi:hypothetical protein